MLEFTTPGLFGKIPSLGDFVSRRVPQSFVDPWDKWLQQALVRSQEQLGNQWLELYLVSPIWRFALSPGVFDSKAWSGVLMPSVDKVGRYFPLTLVTSLADSVNLFDIVAGKMGAKAWFDRAESLALSVLRIENMSIQTLDDQVQALGPVCSLVSASQDSESTSNLVGFDQNQPWRIPLVSTDSVAQLYPKMLQRLIVGQLSTYSLWWSNGSEYVDPSLLVCKRLPPIHGYAAMMRGQWQYREWEDWKG